MNLNASCGTQLIVLYQLIQKSKRRNKTFFSRSWVFRRFLWWIFQFGRFSSLSFLLHGHARFSRCAFFASPSDRWLRAWSRCLLNNLWGCEFLRSWDSSLLWSTFRLSSFFHCGSRALSRRNLEGLSLFLSNLWGFTFGIFFLLGYENDPFFTLLDNRTRSRRAELWGRCLNHTCGRLARCLDIQRLFDHLTQIIEWRVLLIFLGLQFQGFLQGSLDVVIVSSIFEMRV